MSESIVIIDRSEIREGKLDDVKKAMSELVEFAEANEPRMIAYSVYLDPDGTRVTVLQVHPDSASAEYHMSVAGSSFKKFVEYIHMTGIDIYGRPSSALLERLRLKARMLGGASVDVHELHAGFARFGVPAADVPVHDPAVPLPTETGAGLPR
jgi:quinol monooxygenase YgiN